MYYETSYEKMVGEERVLWESLVPHSTELMSALYATHEDNFLLSRYINVLFGLRSAKVDHDDLMKSRNGIYDPESWYWVDKFMLQKTIKDYLGNIDSSLDYLHKFVGFFKMKTGESPYWFERGELEFDQRINDMRNEVMHEGVPSISFDPGRQLMDTCHSDVAGGVERPSVILVRFYLKGEGKWRELGNMVTHTYCETHRLISEVTQELCSALSSGI